MLFESLDIFKVVFQLDVVLAALEYVYAEVVLLFDEEDLVVVFREEDIVLVLLDLLLAADLEEVLDDLYGVVELPRHRVDHQVDAAFVRVVH